MSGRVTTRHLLTCGHVIIQEFGVCFYCKAWYYAFQGKPFARVWGTTLLPAKKG